MDNNELNLDQHISQRYNEDLSELHGKAVTMGEMVEKQLKGSIKSLVKADLALAKKVSKNDHDINQKELDVSGRCVEIVALRQPTASDLRLIFSVEKVTTDLERIGDLSKHLGVMSKKLIKKGVSNKYYEDIENLAQQVKKMLKGTLQAFSTLNSDLAIETISSDEGRINRESEALSRQLITYMMEDPRSIKHVLRVLNVAKALERIGNHCENICEHIVYLVKGEDIRYQNLDDVRSNLFSHLD